jgi:hypothetical protein
MMTTGVKKADTISPCSAEGYANQEGIDSGWRGLPLSENTILDKSPEQAELHRQADIWLATGN